MLLPLFVFVLAVLPAAAQNPPIAQRISISSSQKEAALGARLAEDVRTRKKLLASPAALEYVESLGRELEPHMPDGGPGYTFECLAESGIILQEPGVLPGGYIFVPAGLFLAAESESEFVGMLAHSMAHSAARHGMANRSQAGNSGRVPLLFTIPWDGLHGTETSMPLGFLPVMRTYEEEADRIAVRTMARAGYDPAALFRYIERIQAGERLISGSSRPSREARVAGLQQAVVELPPGQYASGTGRFDQIRALVSAITREARPARPAPSLR